MAGRSSLLAGLLAVLLAGCAGGGGPKTSSLAPVPCYNDTHRPADVYSEYQVEYSYRPGAEAGSAAAQYNLANALLLGAGVARNEAAAATWYRAAVERGHAGAAYYLAALHETGRGVERNWATARKLFQQSAEAGDVKAAECLARYYAGVAGTGEVDPLKAATWFEIAARSRQREDSAYRVLKAQLSANQIAQARAQARKWQPTPMPVTAAAMAAQPFEIAPEVKPVRAGSGVLLAGGSHVLTNAHVVVGCKQIGIIDFEGAERPALTLAVDLSDDIAILRSAGAGGAPRLLAADDPTIGAPIMVIGYPLSDLFGNQAAHMWRGAISELTGPNGNTGFLRMTAPALQGSSGGPVLDERGRLVGIVIGTLDPAKVASLLPVSLGGISYAVKAARIRRLLDRRGLSHLLSDGPAGAGSAGQPPALSQFELADLGRRAAVYVECRE